MLHINIVEASDLPKMDAFGSCDSFCLIQVSGTQRIEKTSVSEDSLNPKWNSIFSFSIMTGEERIKILMKDKDKYKDDGISTYETSVKDIKKGEIFDNWVSMSPVEGVEKGGKLHLKLHYCDKGDAPFVKKTPSKLPPLLFDKPKTMTQTNCNIQFVNSMQPQQAYGMQQNMIQQQPQQVYCMQQQPQQILPPRGYMMQQRPQQQVVGVHHLHQPYGIQAQQICQVPYQQNMMVAAPQRSYVLPQTNVTYQLPYTVAPPVQTAAYAQQNVYVQQIQRPQVVMMQHPMPNNIMTFY